jgi:hypothetical protein
METMSAHCCAVGLGTKSRPSRKRISLRCNEFDRQRYRRLLEISAEMAADNTGMDASVLVKIFTSQIGYATPVDVRAAISGRQAVDSDASTSLDSPRRLGGCWRCPRRLLSGGAEEAGTV